VRQVKGFTIIEMMLVVAIISIFAGMAIPSISNFRDKQRAISPAEAIYSLVAYARSEAIARSAMVYVDVKVTALDTPTTTWAIGVSTNSGGCDPDVTDLSLANACALDVGGQKVLKRITSSDYPGVSLETNEDQIDFDPVRGTVGNAGTITLSFKNRDLFVKVSPIGRVKVCTDPANNTVGGYSSCTG